MGPGRGASAHTGLSGLDKYLKLTLGVGSQATGQGSSKGHQGAWQLVLALVLWPDHVCQVSRLHDGVAHAAT